MIYLFVNYVILSLSASCNYKMAEFKDEILPKVDEKVHEFKSDFITEIKDQIKMKSVKLLELK